jgi:hypothetical protein
MNSQNSKNMINEVQYSLDFLHATKVGSYSIRFVLNEFRGYPPAGEANPAGRRGKRKKYVLQGNLILYSCAKAKTLISLRGISNRASPTSKTTLSMSPEI